MLVVGDRPALSWNSAESLAYGLPLIERMNHKRLPGRRQVFASFALAVSGHGIPSAGAATSGANATQDPSRIVESAGKLYFCSTGGNCASSSDGLRWSEAALRISIPAWAETHTEVTGYSGNQGIWAPDLLRSLAISAFVGGLRRNRS